MRKSEVKTSFLIKKEYLNVIHNRKPEQKAELFDCIFEYQTTGEYKTQSERIEDMMTAMIDFRNKNDEKYDDISEQRSLAGKTHKGNQYTKGDNKRNVSQKLQKNTVEQMEQNGTNGTNGTDKNRLDKIRLDENRIDKKNNILSTKVDNSKAETYGNQEINNLISELKEECNYLGVAYEKKDERNFAKHILTAKDYGEFAEKIGQNRIEFAKNVLRASLKIGFFKGICAGPKPIYQNYAEVYNETMKTKSKAKTIPKF